LFICHSLFNFATKFKSKLTCIKQIYGGKMLRQFQIAMVLLCFLSLSIFAQEIKTPRPSPDASVMQMVGVTEVSIDYSSPGVKGRENLGQTCSLRRGMANRCK